MQEITQKQIFTKLFETFSQQKNNDDWELTEELFKTEFFKLAKEYIIYKHLDYVRAIYLQLLIIFEQDEDDIDDMWDSFFYVNVEDGFDFMKNLKIPDNFDNFDNFDVEENIPNITTNNSKNIYKEENIPNITTNNSKNNNRNRNRNKKKISNNQSGNSFE